jgi:GTP-binding protein
MLNFFSLENKIMFVDMPGYGYAVAPKPVIQQWHELMHEFLKNESKK